MYAAAYSLVCQAYSMILRDLLKKAINDPNEQWDEWALALCDRLFNHEGK